MASCRLSIVIPAFNEAERLPAVLERLCAYLNGQPDFSPFEILVVDDGSQDETSAVVSAVAARYPQIRLLRLDPNHGKGYAVNAGMLAANGEWLLMYDADGATPIEELHALWRAVHKEGCDAAIGSRALPGSEVETPWYRRVMGRVFNAMVWLLIPGVSDTQCGFKLFRRDVAQRVFSVQREIGFAFDVEILYRMRCNGLRFCEVPIRWHDVAGSKIRLLGDSAQMFIALFRIALRGGSLG